MDVQRDLEFQVHNFIKCHELMQKIVKKAKVMLVFISKGQDYRDADVMLQLCKSLVRPIRVL